MILQWNVAAKGNFCEYFRVPSHSLINFVDFNVALKSHLFLQRTVIITLPLSVYWTWNICEPSYITVKGGDTHLMRYHFPSLPIPEVAGHQTVTVNKAWRDLVISILERYTVPEATLIYMIFREMFFHTVNFLSSWLQLGRENDGSCNMTGRNAQCSLYISSKFIFCIIEYLTNFDYLFQI